MSKIKKTRIYHHFDEGKNIYKSNIKKVVRKIQGIFSFNFIYKLCLKFFHQL
jgi:hypothetical protein